MQKILSTYSSSYASTLEYKLNINRKNHCVLLTFTFSAAVLGGPMRKTAIIYNPDVTEPGIDVIT